MRLYNNRDYFGIIFIGILIASILACSEKASIYNHNSLKLVEPVEINSWKSFADGGSIEITFKDSTGKNLTLYYDLSGEGLKKNRHIYIGNMTPDHKNSKKVPIGSTVEKEIVEYISKWMASNFPDYKNNPEQIYQHTNGNLISSASVIKIIEDLKGRTP